MKKGSGLFMLRIKIDFMAVVVFLKSFGYNKNVIVIHTNIYKNVINTHKNNNKNVRNVYGTLYFK